MSKMMRRGIFMFVLLFAVSLGIIYYTIDLEALKTITTFNGESLLLAIIALALGMYFDGLRLQRLVKIGGYHLATILWLCSHPVPVVELWLKYSY